MRFPFLVQLQALRRGPSGTFSFGPRGPRQAGSTETSPRPLCSLVQVESHGMRLDRQRDPHHTALPGRTSGPQSSAAVCKVTGQQAKHVAPTAQQSRGGASPPALQETHSSVAATERRGSGVGVSAGVHACVPECACESMRVCGARARGSA